MRIPFQSTACRVEHCWLDLRLATKWRSRIFRFWSPSFIISLWRGGALDSIRHFEWDANVSLPRHGVVGVVNDADATGTKDIRPWWCGSDTCWALWAARHGFGACIATALHSATHTRYAVVSSARTCGGDRRRVVGVVGVAGQREVRPLVAVFLLLQRL